LACNGSDYRRDRLSDFSTEEIMAWFVGVFPNTSWHGLGA
jgi:hypothetical protein